MAWFFRHESCREELRQVEDRLEALERDFRTIRSEWLDQLDRFHKLVERWVKRVERSEPNDNGATQGEAPPVTDSISARILKRRVERGLRKIVPEG